MKPALKIVLWVLLFQVFVATMLRIAFDWVFDHILSGSTPTLEELQRAILARYYIALGLSFLAILLSFFYLQRYCSWIWIVVAILCEIAGYFLSIRILL